MKMMFMFTTYMSDENSGIGRLIIDSFSANTDEMEFRECFVG